MSILVNLPVKLFTGIIFKPSVNLENILSELSTLYGPVDSHSTVFDFEHTSYYTEEMGYPLKKCFCSFKNLVNPEHAFQSKLASVKLEASFAVNHHRTVNIDPGILSYHNVILFSTKPYAHRILLQQKIYADLTLLYKNKSFEFLPWTYPDFMKDDYLTALSLIRDHYCEQIKYLKKEHL